MPRVSPTAEGFRAVFRRPSLTLGEITWRWSVGATATILFLFGFFEFLDTLPVTNGEVLLLRTRNPYLVGQTIARILQGSQARAFLSLAMAVLLLGLLWMIAASIGRIITVRAILEYIGEAFGDRIRGAGVSIEPHGDIATSSASALLRLNFLRFMVAFAAIIGFVGAGILARFASPAKDPQSGLAFLVFLPLGALIALVWFILNWFLSLSGMLAVRNHENALEALTAAGSLCRERTGAVIAVSAWTGLAHLALFAGAMTVVGFPLGLAGLVPGRVILGFVILITLAYFAVADWIYMARLAGYLCISELPEALLKPAPPIPAVPPTPLQTTIDRDEPILSDVPGLIPET